MRLLISRIPHNAEVVLYTSLLSFPVPSFLPLDFTSFLFLFAPFSLQHSGSTSSLSPISPNCLPITASPYYELFSSLAKSHGKQRKEGAKWGHTTSRLLEDMCSKIFPQMVHQKSLLFYDTCESIYFNTSIARCWADDMCPTLARCWRE